MITGVINGRNASLRATISLLKLNLSPIGYFRRWLRIPTVTIKAPPMNSPGSTPAMNNCPMEALAVTE